MPNKKVLIAGAGVAGLEAALALREIADDYVDVELLAPESEFVYRPLSVTAPFRMGETRRFPLRRLVEEAGGSLAHHAVQSVDPDSRTVATADGAEVGYDLLLLALGATPVAAIPGALTFRGPQDEEQLGGLLDDARSGRVRRIVFALPSGASWPLPLYELALMTAVHLADTGVSKVELELVTPEAGPLLLFGKRASNAVVELLESHGIAIHADTIPVELAGETLRLVGGDSVETDRVVAVPQLEGPRLPGVPADAKGFVPTDDHGRVHDLPDVFAAGDLTDFPVKQGGLAAQQADAAADSIAAAAGAPIDPTAFTPVLRGLLLTGLTPRYLRAVPSSMQAEVDTDSLWWPPAKIVGRHLAPFLAAHLDVSAAPQAGGDVVEVDVELDRGPAGSWVRQ
jgi:sulfide:quinone oxidoreductase